MFKRLISAALIFGAAAMAPPAYANGHVKCLDRDAMVQVLENRYKETLKSIGLQNANQLLEIWSSDDSGSFTILITRTDGTSCVVAVGQNWSSFETVAKLGIES